LGLNAYHSGKIFNVSYVHRLRLPLAVQKRTGPRSVSLFFNKVTLSIRIITKKHHRQPETSKQLIIILE